MTPPLANPVPAAPADLGGWLHDLNPFVWRISGDFGIRWYGLAYIAGFTVAYLIIRWLAKRGAARIPVDRVFDAIVALVLGTVVGGRLGYVLIYQPSLLWHFDKSVPWWGVLAINNGGMASHGAFIGLIIAAWWVSRGFKNDDGQRIGRCPPMHVMDLLPLAAMPGYVLGRIANFVNGELLGKIVAMPGERAPWWAVRFPQEILSDKLAPPLTEPQHDQLVDLVTQFAQPGESFDDASSRMIAALWRGAPDLHDQLLPLISARHPSQLYQALEGVVVGIIVWVIARKPRLPGVVGCWFLITYGAARIITELWRLPDDHFAVPRPLGLSRGQWLSAAMILAGAVILVVVTRRGGEKLGGWLVPNPAPAEQPDHAADENR